MDYADGAALEEDSDVVIEDGAAFVGSRVEHETHLAIHCSEGDVREGEVWAHAVCVDELVSRVDDYEVARLGALLTARRPL